MLHAASTSSPRAMRFLGMSDNPKYFLAASGSLLNSNYKVSVVIIVVLLGVPRV